jgi:hypothetical protein
MYRSQATGEILRDAEMSEDVLNPLGEENRDPPPSIMMNLLDLRTYSAAYQTIGLADGVDEIVGGVKQVEEAVKDVLVQEVTEVCSKSFFVFLDGIGDT